MRGSSRFGICGVAVGAMAMGASACSSPSGSPEATAAAVPVGPYSCQRPLGTVVVIPAEPAVQHQDLPPVEPLLGVLSRQSRCFLVAARSKAIEEVALREQQLSGRQGGGLTAADFTLATAITFVGKTGESKLSGLLGGSNGAPGSRLLSKWGGFVNQTADTAFESEEADIVLTLVDNRTGIEIGAAKGTASASTTNITGSLGALWSADSGGGSASAYQKTPEARLVSAAVIDGFGKLVASVEPDLAYRGDGPATIADTPAQ